MSAPVKALKPGDTIGVLGGGQLGRMLALAAARLGLKTHVFCPDEASPAFDVSAQVTIAAYDDQDALARFADSADVITYEFENVPAPTADYLRSRRPVRPGPRALSVSQDRLHEKTFLRDAGVPVADFAPIDGEADLEAALKAFGGAGVLKTRRMGYDGKGQVMLKSIAAAAGALETLAYAPSILEALIPFEREVSVIVARGASGETAAYDATENHHENHILKTSTVPANLEAETMARACALAKSIANSLEYIGVMGVEMFVLREDGRERLIINEIAPRVHNSGHWTDDACAVSQFEQHIRAVAGWPLGDPTRHSDVVMENLIGGDADGWRDILREPNAVLHLYGKAQSRPGRKMGHVNRLSPRTAAK